MNKEINLNDVIEFIKKYGYKYNYQIQRELDKTRKFTIKDIDQEIKVLIDSFGFPIACCVAMGFFIWNMYNKMSLTLDEVTKTNSELVLTNSSLIKNMDNKIDKLEEKVDKVVDNIGK